MISLIYVSSAIELFSQVELELLLDRSRRNNAKAGLTGMLLYRGGNFMQVLEGPDEAVAGLEATILQDPRHRGMERMIREPITTRQFADWTMGFTDLDDPAVRSRPGFSEFLETPLTAGAFAADRSKAGRLLGMFRANM